MAQLKLGLVVAFPAFPMSQPAQGSAAMLITAVECGPVLEAAQRQVALAADNGGHICKSAFYVAASLRDAPALFQIEPTPLRLPSIHKQRRWPIMTGRIGAVSYLNTKPLIYDLQQRLPNCELLLDLPSRLADRLARGQLDVALIPSVEFLRAPRLSIISDACIACRGPVRSVRLLFRKPPAQVRSLALDEGSRTSAVLSQVLLAQRFGIRPKLLPLHIAAPLSSIDADALLVIGDRAMKIDGDEYVANWDLGEEWVRETGLPFVFAMWVANKIDPGPVVLEALQAARDEGLASASQIAEAEAPRYGLTTQDCLTYFLHQLHFTLGPMELRGLDLFRQRGMEFGLLPTNCHQLDLEPI